ncbi:thiamine pyrophosphate-binding protein [Plantactinospora sp. BC1]|uniref:alpha-keto acid decarboxylase family protein n=1 Tax=Plantactinospora sp. BC1 TaxID=2108470 RepID=UPI000D16A361|nr:thiamine pyrophosphate-binding protein [Plantactinospora sp. BC1]AVT34372.1 thiamine pyrophosphate-binding protein [Plantactinospora sp. BC1]
MPQNSAETTVETTTVGEYLLCRLHDLGVRHIFGLPGDYNMEFLDQVEAFPDIEWIGSCNEVNAAYAADGYARLAGISAIVTTFGPGELSVVNGLAGAMAESVPIVSIVGGPTTEIMDRRAAMHHSIGDGDFDRWVRVAREVTVAQATLTAGNATVEIDRVLRECWTQQRPVYLRLPGDVARQPVPKPPRRFDRPAPEVAREQLDAFDAAAQRLLNGATCPALLVGNLALRYGLGAEIAALLADRHWPAATQGLGRGLLDETGPNYVGVYNGGDSAEPVRRIVEEADVLVCVGTKFFDWDGLFTADLDPDRIISIGRRASSVGGRLFEPVAPAAALARLHTLGPVRAVDWATAPDPGRPPAARLDPASNAPITQARLWPAVSAMLAEGDIVVPETGTPSFGVASIRLPRGAVCVQAPLWGAIGYAVPAAFGAATAAPQRRVVLITGDGSLQLTAQEISRMIATGQRPVILVLNNAGYTVERAVDGRHQPYNDIDNWRYADLPAVFTRRVAVDSHLVSTEGELARVLAELGGVPDRPTVVEVVLDPQDLPAGMPQWGRETTAVDYQSTLGAEPRLSWRGLPDQLSDLPD